MITHTLMISVSPPDLNVCAQQSINCNIVSKKINQLTTTNDLRISKSKTWYMNFCHLRKMHNDPMLELDGTEICVLDQFNFHGLIFDKKNFNPLLAVLKKKCSKALNILHIIVHMLWGTDQQTQFKLYKNYYVCFIYGSTRNSYKKIS